MCSPIVLIGLSVLSKIMMKAFLFLAAGDDGDDDEGTDAAKGTGLHTQVAWPQAHLHRFL